MGVHVCVLGWGIHVCVSVLGWAFMCVRVGIHVCMLGWAFMNVC